MGTHLKPGAVGLVSLLVTVLGVAPGLAQTAVSGGANASPGVAATPQAAASPTGIEEIVVTAQKREQLSQQVPIALTALSAEKIRFRGIDDLSDLMLQVPGLQYGMDLAGDQQIFIRGIGVDDSSGTMESPIATYVDGVYQNRSFRAPTLGIDVDRIEVLKGPQGTLYGRNATGGAVNIVLTPPSDELTGVVKVGGGSYGQVLTDFAVSGPLVKHVLDIRISGQFEHYDGWVINELSGRPVNDLLQSSGRIALAYHPLDNLSIDYELLANKNVGGGVNGIDTNIALNTPAVQKATFGFVIPPKDYLSDPGGNNPWEVKSVFPYQGDQENTQNAATIKWDLASWLSLKSISAFQEHTVGKEKYDDEPTSFVDLVDFEGRDDDDKAFSQELDLTGTNEVSFWKGEQPFTWIVGGFYSHEFFAESYPAGILYNTLTLHDYGKIKLDDYSVFGDGTMPLPWKFSLFGGVRFTYDRLNTSQNNQIQFGVNKGPYLHIPGATCDSSYIDNFHNVSYRVGMGWAPNEALNFYVKYSTGYNAGGHYTSACNDKYKEETVGTIEGGVKGRWLDGRLVTDFAGYYTKFENFQFFQALPPAAAEEVNAPEAEEWGGEFAVTAIPIEDLSIDLAATVMHSQYDNFHDEDPINPAAGAQNLSGHQVLRAPNSTEQVGLEYDWRIPWHRILSDSVRQYLDLGALRLRGEWYHTDYLVYRPFNKGGFLGNNDVQNPYSIFNFYATLPTEDGKWSLRFFAKNFTNTKYYQYKLETSAWWDGTGGMPPWFGGDLTYRW